MALWNEIDPELEFSHFNIFEDQEVREGIKSTTWLIYCFITLYSLAYSNWPSFPQLYIEGDLVGGLDVMRWENS